MRQSPNYRPIPEEAAILEGEGKHMEALAVLESELARLRSPGENPASPYARRVKSEHSRLKASIQANQRARRPEKMAGSGQRRTRTGNGVP
jgi:hypothetical protein